MSVCYSDITTAEGREEFLTTTQQPTPIPELPATNSPVDNLDAIFMEMLPLPNEAQPQAEDNAQTKRSYRRVSQNDGNDLKRKWNEHGEEWTAQRYSQETGIKLSMVRKFLSKLRKGLTIDLASTTHGRRHVITREVAQSMIERIEENNQVTIREICTHVYERHNVKISESTVSRFFSSPRIVTMDLYMFTFKRVANREPTSNSPHIKDLRKERVLEQYNYICSGYIPTYVDESSVQLASVRNYGWAPPGENTFAYKRNRYIGLTAISFISIYGLNTPSLSRDPSLGRSSPQQ